MFVQTVRSGDHSDCQAQEANFLLRWMPTEMVEYPYVHGGAISGSHPPFHLPYLQKSIHCLRQFKTQVLQPPLLHTITILLGCFASPEKQKSLMENFPKEQNEAHTDSLSYR